MAWWDNEHNWLRKVLPAYEESALVLVLVVVVLAMVLVLMVLVLLMVVVLMVVLLIVVVVLEMKAADLWSICARTGVRRW